MISSANVYVDDDSGRNHIGYWKRRKTRERVGGAGDACDVRTPSLLVTYYKYSRDSIPRWSSIFKRGASNRVDKVEEKY